MPIYPTDVLFVHGQPMPDYYVRPQNEDDLAFSQELTEISELPENQSIRDDLRVSRDLIAATEGVLDDPRFAPNSLAVLARRTAERLIELAINSGNARNPMPSHYGREAHPDRHLQKKAGIVEASKDDGEIDDLGNKLDELERRIKEAEDQMADMKKCMRHVVTIAPDSQPRPAPASETPP